VSAPEQLSPEQVEDEAPPAEEYGSVRQMMLEYFGVGQLAGPGHRPESFVGRKKPAPLLSPDLRDWVADGLSKSENLEDYRQYCLALTNKLGSLNGQLGLSPKNEQRGEQLINILPEVLDTIKEARYLIGEPSLTEGTIFDDDFLSQTLHPFEGEDRAIGLAARFKEVVAIINNFFRAVAEIASDLSQNHEPARPAQMVTEPFPQAESEPNRQELTDDELLDRLAAVQEELAYLMSLIAQRTPRE
jgi:hypothetical protein